MLRRPSLLILAVVTACTGGGEAEVRPSPSTPPTPPPPTLPAVDTIETRPLQCADTAERMNGPFEVVPIDLDAPSVHYLWGAAAAVGDLDADGLPDIVALQEGGPVVFRNPGWEAEPLGGAPQPASIAMADVEGDGDLDLYIGTFAGLDVLLLNDGSGGFVDASSQLLDNDVRNSMSVSFADIDGDADLDALVLTTGDVVDDLEIPVRHFPPSAPAMLWENQGDGTFIDVADRLPAALHSGFSLAGGLHDMDRDGAVDIYAVNDFGGAHGPNVWLRGDGSGQFTLDETWHGLGITTTGMGLGLGDVNGDGFDDVSIAYWGGIRVLESVVEPELAWFDQTVVRLPEGFGPSEVAWGGDYADFDNDGDLDLYVSFGHLEFGERFPNPLSQRDRLFLSVAGQGAWVDATDHWQVGDPGISRGTVVADLDDDGWLDIVRPSQDGAAVLLSRCASASGLRVELRQSGPNPLAVGAVITLDTLAGPQTRTVRAGGTNYASSGPPEVHFGLGTESAGDVTVTWPDGSISRFEDVPAGHAARIERAVPGPG